MKFINRITFLFKGSSSALSLGFDATKEATEVLQVVLSDFRADVDKIIVLEDDNEQHIIKSEELAAIRVEYYSDKELGL